MTLNNTDYKYFSKAKHIAEVSDYPKIHVGCIAVCQNQVIAIGCNSNKTHPLQKRYNKYRDECDSLLPKLHAEINCINTQTFENQLFKSKAVHIQDWQ